MARRMVFALAALAGFLSAAPMALSAEGTCGGSGEEIVAKAYPGARALPGNVFEVDGSKLTLSPSGDRTGDDPTVMLCRAWAARPEFLLVAVPLMREGGQQGRQGDLELLVLDRRNHDVKHRHRLAGVMDDDAIAIEELSIDVGPYQLGPQNLAFGVRRLLRGSSRPNPFSETDLWLFSIEGGQMNAVVENLAVARHSGEWDTQCVGKFENMIRILSMYRSPNPAFADIVISETVYNRVNTGTLDECESSETMATAMHRLTFKDGSYVLPKVLRGR